MKLVYISHPYTGNERKNRQSARKVCSELKQKNRCWCIFNPLDAFQWVEKTKLKYDAVMEMCMEILTSCDAIYMCKGWEDSKGCQREKKEAETMGIEVIYDGRDD